MPPASARPAYARPIPLWLKIAYSGFLAVMIPVYWANYGPTNFLYFCDVALLLTFVGIWREDALLISLPAVGILLPQVLWCADFLVQLCGGKMTGMTLCRQPLLAEHEADSTARRAAIDRHGYGAEADHRHGFAFGAAFGLGGHSWLK